MLPYTRTVQILGHTFDADDAKTKSHARAPTRLALFCWRNFDANPWGPVSSSRTPRLHTPRSVKDSGILSRLLAYRRRLLMQAKKARTYRNLERALGHATDRLKTGVLRGLLVPEGAIVRGGTRLAEGRSERCRGSAEGRTVVRR